MMTNEQMLAGISEAAVLTQSKIDQSHGAISYDITKLHEAIAELDRRIVNLDQKVSDIDQEMTSLVSVWLRPVLVGAVASIVGLAIVAVAILVAPLAFPNVGFDLHYGERGGLSAGQNSESSDAGGN